MTYTACLFRPVALAGQPRRWISTPAAPVSHPRDLTVHWKSGIFAPTGWFSTTKASRLFKYSWNVMSYNSVAFKHLQNVDAVAEFLTWFCPIWNSPQSSSQQLILSPVQQLHDHWFQWQYSEDTGPAGGTPYLHPSRPQGDTTAVIIHPLRTALEHH